MPKITILKANVTKPAGKNYEVCELGYKTDEGKVKAMKILSFVQPEVFRLAANTQPGDVVEATFSQSEKGYWQFSSLTATGVKEATPVGAVSSVPSQSRGNWETSEERAQRQIMIVRQSSLSNAVALIAARNPKGATETATDVIEVARRFENYVLGVTGEVE